MLGGNAEHLTRAGAAQARRRARTTSPGRRPTSRSIPKIKERDRRGPREGEGARRPVHPRHRAPRVAPHRQPAARPLRAPGRPGRVALLPVRRGRPRAPVRRRPHLPDPRPARARSTSEGREQPIEAKMLSRTIENAQKKVEEQNFLIRKRVLEYDDVMNQQREVIYKYRREILEGRDMSEPAKEELRGVFERIVQEYTPGDFIEDWDLDGLFVQVAPDLRPELRRRGPRGRVARPRRARRRACTRTRSAPTRSARRSSATS